MKRVANAFGKADLGKRVCAAFALCAATAMALNAAYFSRNRTPD
jgi:hypothetical protein